MMRYLQLLRMLNDAYQAASTIVILLFALTAPVWATVAILLVMQCFAGDVRF